MPLLYLSFLIAFSWTLQAQQSLKNHSFGELDSLVMLGYQQGNFNLSLEATKVAASKAKEKFGRIDSTYAEYVSNLGFFSNRIGDFKNAVLYNEETLELASQIYGVEHYEYSRALNNLAGMYSSVGKTEAAEKLWLKALKLREKLLTKNSAEYTEPLNNLALMYGDEKRFDEAEALFLEVISIQEKLKNVPKEFYSSSLNNLGLLYLDLERWKEAEHFLENALKIKKEHFGPQHPYITQTLMNLGNVYVQTNRLLEAEASMLESLTIRGNALGKEHPSYADNLNNLAAFYVQAGQVDKVEAMYKEALKIYEKKIGRRADQYCHLLVNLGFFYNKQNRLNEGKISLIESIRNNSGLEIGTSINEEWADSLTKANYVSLESMEKALLGLFYLLEQDSNKIHHQEQVIIADLAMALLKKNRDDFTVGNDKLRTLASSLEWTLLSLKAIDKEKELEKAFAFAEQSKSVLLMDASNADQAHSFGDLPAVLVEQELELQKKHAKFEAQLYENRPPEEKEKIRSQLNDLNIEIKAFKKEIENKYPQYAQLKYQHKDASIREIQEQLDEKTALIEYVIGEDVIYAFFVAKASAKLIECKVETKELKIQVNRLRSALSNYNLIAKDAKKSLEIYSSAAYWIYEQLLLPVLPQKEGVEHLVLVTDGELGHIPFEALLMKPIGQSATGDIGIAYHNLDYLLNRFRISYDYSATLWKENRSNKKRLNNGQMLAMAANYEMLLDDAQAFSRLPSYQRLRKALKPLPNAQNEVEVLSKQFHGMFAFDKEASEQNFKKIAKDYRIIHLAMHGILDSQHPTLSSLAFTENGDSLENNFLQAYEISKLKLNADLVVLSACETGYGKFEAGNGIASLARAFMYAGASSLVVSLWQVNDFTTAVIMQNFYQNLNEGMNKAEALQKAKLDYIQTAEGIAAHPAFWSPFIQIGDSRPLSIQTSTTSFIWLLILGITALAGGFFLMRRRKEV